VFRLIERHDEKLIMFFQFFPGLCTVTPMAFGMTRVSAARFIALDLLGNVTWTLVFAGGGYLFGEAFGYLVGELHAWMVYVSAAIFLVMTGLLFWQGQRFLARKLER
jgi:membrane protein DedA with SNARE-associated domain